MPENSTPMRMLLGVIIVAGLVLTGCESRDDRDAAGPAAGPAATQPEPGTATVPAAVDAEDEPNAPRALPRSGQIRGWIKTRPVRVLNPAAIPEAFGAPAVPAYTGIPLKQAAATSYKRDGVQADVLLVEAGSAADAFSLFTFRAGGRVANLRPDGSMRVALEEAGARWLCNWLGKWYLEVEATGEQAGDNSVEALINRTLLPLQAGDAPLLLRAIPADQRADCRLWLVRSTRWLLPVEELGLNGVRPETIDELLGLSGEATLAVATIQLPERAHRDLVWLAAYPTDDGAKAAFDRYAASLSSGGDQATRVMPPVGRYLVGSWRARDTAVQDLLILLHSAIVGPGLAPAASQPR